MKGFLHGGAGGEDILAFRVLGGTSAPSNPRENDIWVKTSTKITSYAFSATQPTGTTGMVWFFVSTSSSVEFNALSKDGINVYPISAKQYISGAWSEVDAQTYKNGKWTDWASDFYFVKNGERTSDPTYISATQNSTLALENGLLTIKPSGDSYRGLYFRGKKENHTTLNIDGVFTGNDTTIKVWNISDAPSWQSYDTTAISSASVNQESGTLDISNLANGEYYFGFCSKYNETNKIRNFWLR